jgi:hypothetical protein
MGNTAYLIKNGKNSSQVLFEAKNTIPVFWFGLLDLPLIEKVENDLINSFNNDDEEYFNIKISKETFIANLLSVKDFFQRYYIEKMNLYNDFIKYLDKTFTGNDLLELNILEIANFSDIKTFINGIKNILKNINANVNKLAPYGPDKNIFSFVGYDEFYVDEFKRLF